ncbi:MAG TPA: CDP-alcohol phosphatidyltransferase family protein [Ktedonobacteraceae bacterium]|nr:CDP-alcohol phosphatidyltransferase family protein [Ktedonobacteraceae bacterium]
MAQTVNDDAAFVVNLLTTLRDEKFSARAWARFLARSWEMSCYTARTHPTMKRSWQHVSMLIGIVALAILVATFFIEGATTALHLFPGLVFFVAWQQSDLFWHLGLNRHVRTGQLFPVVGVANTLTELRGLGAAFLLARLVAGIPTPSGLALAVFLVGGATDILDGQIARRTETQSKLGQIADGEADFCLYLALTIILIQNAVLPLWLGLIMLLRFFIPLIAALGSYFVFARPVRYGSTVWGKYAGLAQCLYFLVMIAPPQLNFLTRYINLPLLIATLILLIAAPLAQIIENLRIARG